MAENIIVGSGISGLVAAINLAKEGLEVLVIDREKKLGGSPMFHPSTHITPIDTKKTWEYIGINLDDYFVNLKSLKFYIEGKPWRVDHRPIYMVERSSRETSLDTFLYNEAVKHGVKFEFGRGIESKSDLDGLPPGTILATGMYHEMFELLGMPYRVCDTYIATANCDRHAEAQGYWGKYTGDYAYTAMLNGILMTLIFNEDKLPEGARDRFADLIRETEGVEVSKWKKTFAAAANKPILFHDKFILTGSLGGWQDPLMFFGIAGAVTSGKTAAIAVMNREQAIKDFKYFTGYFKRTMFLRNLYLKVPWPIMKRLSAALLSNPELFGPIVDFLQKGVPAHRGERYFQRYKGDLDRR